MAPARRVGSIAEQVAGLAPPAVLAGIDEPVARNTRIHDVDCLHLNTATNVMAPRRGVAVGPVGFPGLARVSGWAVRDRAGGHRADRDG